MIADGARKQGTASRNLFDDLGLTSRPGEPAIIVDCSAPLDFDSTKKHLEQITADEYHEIEPVRAT